MEHPLDNPPWNALITGNKHLATGTDEVKYFAIDVSPFAGMAANTPQHFATLYQLLPPKSTVSFFSPEEIEVPRALESDQAVKGFPRWYMINPRRMP